MTQHLADELGRLGAMFRNESKVRLGADRGQYGESARRDSERADTFRVDAVVPLPVPEHVVDGGVELSGAPAVQKDAEPTALWSA